MDPVFLQTYTIPIVIGGVALVIFLVFWLERKRRNDLMALAASMGLRFSPEGPDVYSLEGTQLELFRLGRSRKAANMIEVSSAGGQIRVFDYRYTTGSGKHSQTHNFTVALIASGGNVPQFDLKPETFMYKIGELVGFKDIDLPAFPLFSEKYRLTGPDEAAVHLFFTPRRAAWFESRPGLRVQGAAGHALLFKENRRLPVDDWMTFIEEAKAFASEALK
ncbi:MAG TPA: hypothetical protein DCQ25_01065 [Elusimicrobia bacterium]|nr:hypothetical protein [Elusimicrobiota bacterium]